MTDTADQNPDHDKIPTPTWDLEDDTKPAYVMDLREWLPYENTKFDGVELPITMSGSGLQRPQR